MNRNITVNILRFLGFILLQALIVNQITLHQFINPYVYPMFILLLPFETPIWLVMTLGFSLGLGIDIFSQSMGIHAAATTFMAFLRPYVIKLLSPIGGYETEDKPHIANQGLVWYLSYATILILGHHTFLIILEYLSLAHLGFELLKVVSSSVVSLILIVLIEYTLSSKR
ncbi:MAG: rod shape-determining protein MreD [Bacteroidetes bacterium]|nr:rod shape-determining protein MreD [Bacteroidota bacterium]